MKATGRGGSRRKEKSTRVEIQPRKDFEVENSDKLKKKKINKKNFFNKELWDNFKRVSINMTGIPEGEKRIEQKKYLNKEWPKSFEN